MQAVEQRRGFIRRRGGEPRWRRGRIGPAGALLTRALPGAGTATGRRPGSRLLHSLGDFTAHAAAGLLAAAAVLVWLLVAALLGFPNWWDNVLYIVSSSASLRAKIDRPFGRNSIEAVRGVGYRFDPAGG